MPLPWRPEEGSVVRMFCHITHQDGTPFEYDSRALLEKAIKAASEEGLQFSFGTEQEFYLFRSDDFGEPTMIPYDHAGYMDIAPEDKGENIRREICLTLEQMGIHPESSHHEQGPGQNEIDFRYSDALTAADQTTTFKWVVEMVAAGNGLEADFTPKPLPKEAGNGMHINLSLRTDATLQSAFLAGILAHIPEMTLFLNPHADSFLRLGEKKAPRYISWSHENRSTLIRIPAVKGGRSRIELRSPDPMANPYLCYALLIHAGMDGIRRNLQAGDPLDVNLYTAGSDITRTLQALPADRQAAWKCAASSEFIAQHVPKAYLDAYR